MSAVAIFGLLTGIVLAWGFRVWILIPTTLAIFLGTSIYLVFSSRSFFDAIGQGFLVSLVPQLGYFIGLSARYVTVALRSPREPAATATEKLDSVNY